MSGDFSRLCIYKLQSSALRTAQKDDTSSDLCALIAYLSRGSGTFVRFLRCPRRSLISIISSFCTVILNWCCIWINCHVRAVQKYHKVLLSLGLFLCCSRFHLMRFICMCTFVQKCSHRVKGIHSLCCLYILKLFIKNKCRLLYRTV